MSADSPAAPRLSLNVRCTQKVQEKRGEEAQVEILEDEEHHADLGSQKARASAEKSPAAVRRSCFRAAAVTLGGMFVLMLAGIYARYFLAILEKNELQRRFDNPSNNHSLLEEEVKQLQGKISAMCCPDGWKSFGCSCYFKASERKRWEESRTDCHSRDADLVVVNSREEHEFVRELTEPGASWIGLKAKYQHKSTGWEPRWEWVDGSSLTVVFWETGHSQKTWYQYVECCSEQGKWTQSRHYNSNYWICEKATSCRLC